MVQAVRGMRDVLPAEARRWRLVENAVRSVLERFAYEEIQLPLMEQTELFARGVGEATDIVEKEMYTLADGEGDSLSLRPEGTAGCVRALQENGLLYNQTQKVFYAGPMFRYERPQKGRYRQFYQIGAEAFGFAGPDVDAELILLGAEFWRQLGIGERVYLAGETAGITPDAWDSLRRTKIFYKAPITTPQGGGFKSLNVTVRKSLGLFANIRPCAAYAPFVATKHPGMDVVIVRENEEDLYAGIEHRQTDEVYQCLKLVSRPGCEKIVYAATTKPCGSPSCCPLR